MPTWSLRWPQRLQPALLGIDLGADRCRLLACSRSGPAWAVEQCASAPLEEGLREGRVPHFEQAAQALQQLVASAGQQRRVALALPPSPVWREVLDVPGELRPWHGRRWLSERAEQLSGQSSDSLSWAAELLPGPSARLSLSVRPLDVVQDWQGLAEAAGLDLVLLDDRQRVMQVALRALGLFTGKGSVWLAEAGEQTCTLHHWRADQLPEQWTWGAEQPLIGLMAGGDGAAGLAPAPLAQAWLVGSPSACGHWANRLHQEWGGAWHRLDPLAGCPWREDLPRPADAGAFLAALGLALRAWHP